MNSANTHALYRFFDRENHLLYVGITVNPANRWVDHRHQKPWWQQVARITIETHPDRKSVLAAELNAIQIEQPTHNIQHKSKVSLIPSTPTPDQNTHWRTGALWTASEMPDYCARCTGRPIYLPYHWDAGLASYLCQVGHQWTCHWGHRGAGEALENQRRLAS